MAVLVTGGARSGKSGFAEACSARLGTRGIYVATSQPFDGEMAERAERHRLDRAVSGFPWETVEEPLALAELLGRMSEAYGGAGSSEPPVVLVDCLTLWLTNRLLALDEADSFTARDADSELERLIEELVLAAARYPHPLVLVTNEVGSGIVPEYSLGRRFRDLAGRLNRRMAEVCDRVFLVTAG
ncbi:bifunctional adenosylcobinamide kinase/adenosylcobinamide-phosphate guanylyltransferase, partial [Paenibacillus darwinianus]